MATGGIYFPAKNHRIPESAAVDRCLWKKEWGSVNLRPYNYDNQRFGYRDLLIRGIYDSRCGALMLKIRGQPFKARSIVTEIMNHPLDFYTKSGLLAQPTLDAVMAGHLSETDLENHMRRRLIGFEPIGGVVLSNTGHTLSLWEAATQGLISKTVANELMEAQVAATGSLIDINHGKVTIDRAERAGIISPQTADVLRKFSASHRGSRSRDSIVNDLESGTVSTTRTLRMLEVQLACGGVVDPSSGFYFQADAAIKTGLITETILQKVHALKAFNDLDTDQRTTYLSLCLKCKPTGNMERLVLPVKSKKQRQVPPQGVPSGKEKQRRRRIVIEDPKTKAEISIKTAFERDLITREDAISLLQQEGKSEEQIEQIISTKSRRKSSTSDLTSQLSVEHSTLDSRSEIFSGSSSASLNFGSDANSRTATPSLNAVDAAELEEKLNQLISAGQPIAAIRDESTGEIVSIPEAERRRLIDSLTEQRILEAQAVTGGVIDPNDPTGPRLLPSEAAQRSLINPRLISSLNEALKGFKGFYDRRSRKDSLSLAEALRHGSGSYEVLTRLLEMQLVLGGIIDVKTGEKISLQEAKERNWIDGRKAERMMDFSKHSRQLVDPLTNMNTSYASLLKQTVTVDGLTILPALARGQRSLKLASGAQARAASIASSRASSRGSSPPPEMRITRNMGQF